ncbi:MAG: bifunctional folylpolyglutamate synthase/dihydrofolate synthase [Treponemataceae bacterium]
MNNGDKGVGKKNLETMQFLVNILDNPHTTYKSIHIAGSKGKGSIATLLANVLDAAGFKTGLFTSPHILSFFERITQAGTFFESTLYEKSAQEFYERFSSIPQKEFPCELFPSWFEMVTAYSFLCFKNAGCQYVVFETGLGGRLDATNVLTPEFCIITPIEYEHTEILGNSLAKIASEKAGIFKESVPVISTKQKCTTKRILKKIAKKKYAEFSYIPRHINLHSFFLHDLKMNVVLLLKKQKKKITFCMNLLGKAQAENAMCIIFAIKKFFPEISSSVLINGIKKTKITGRFEIFTLKKYSISVIFDVAHTHDSLKSTLNAYQKIFSKQKAFLLFSCAGDKNISRLAKTFRKVRFQKIFVTIPGNFKKTNFIQLKNSFFKLSKKTKSDFSADENFSSIINNVFREAIENKIKTILVTGSFYLVAEVKKELEHFDA